MKKLTVRSVHAWLDEHLLFILSCFLFAFIPLFPKIPLFDIIPNYLVRVRAEDFCVLLAVSVWAIQVYRGKVSWKTPLTFAIGLYAVAGILSLISGVLVTQTIPAQLLHIAKSGIHFFRYMEYFSLLFVVAAGITSKQRVYILLGILMLTVLAISIYGYGQRFWYWPVYSTMNREFSKGLRLYLTEHARVQSTFGGHYDLAAYLVLVLPFILSAYYFIKNNWVRAAAVVVFLAGLWTLVQTASRSSFAAYFLGVGFVVLLYAAQQKTWLLKGWSLLRSGFVVLAVSSYMLLQFGDDMYERLLQTLESYPAAYQQYEAFNKERKTRVDASTKYVVGLFTDQDSEQVMNDLKENLADATQATPPPDGMSLEDLEVMVASDQRPTPAVPGDVYVDVPVTEQVATVSAEGVASTVTVTKDREYSGNALLHGLSMAIRLDTLWPRALDGFYANPLLGTGYATLTKSEVGQFTEAESTDNNFLRTLGETGLLGFITFYGVVALGLYQAWLLYRGTTDAIAKVFAIGYVGGTFGLLFNAGLIDVFAASKVAFTFWSLTGVLIALGYLYNQTFTLRQPRFMQPTLPAKTKVQKA